MALLRAILFGIAIAITLPMVFGGLSGIWMQSWAAWGTIAPLEGSPGLLFSIPAFAAGTIAFWLFFNWHNS